MKRKTLSYFLRVNIIQKVFDEHYFNSTDLVIVENKLYTLYQKYPRLTHSVLLSFSELETKHPLKSSTASNTLRLNKTNRLYLVHTTFGAHVHVYKGGT